MRLHLPSLFSLSFLLCPLSASAHDTLPNDWCDDPESIPVVVREFEFDETQLRQRIEIFEETHDHKIKPVIPGVLDARCGIVDLWSWADLIAAGYCAEEVEEERAMPVILGPENFLQSDHHLSYRLGDGLTGACVVCKHQ